MDPRRTDPHLFSPVPALSPLLAALFLATAPARLVAQSPGPAPAPPGVAPAVAAPSVPAPPVPPQEAGFLGVAIDDVTRGEAEELGLGEARGALITEVVEESPAAEAGLLEDDVVLSWNGQEVMGALHLRRLVRETPPGRTVSVALFRDGQRREMDVTVGERSGPSVTLRAMDDEDRRELEVRLEEARERALEAREHARERRLEARDRAREGRERARELRAKAFRLAHRAGPRIGVRLFSLTDQLGSYFGLDGDDGALVIHVQEDSPADSAGLRAGDVIVSVDGGAVENPGDASRHLRGAAGETVEIEVLRRGERRTLSVPVPEGAGDATLGFPGMEEMSFDLERIGPEVRAALEGVELPLRAMELRPLLRGTRGNGDLII